MEVNKYILNKMNEENKKGGKELRLFEYDIQTAEITKSIVLPFPVDATEIIFSSSRAGFFTAYRITRFKPLLFSVERFNMEMDNKKVVSYYDTKPKKNPVDIFDAFDFDEIFFEAKSSNFEFSSEVCNVGEISTILINFWDNRMEREKFLKIMARFFKISNGGLFSEIKESIDKDFYSKIKFYEP